MYLKNVNISFLIDDRFGCLAVLLVFVNKKKIRRNTPTYTFYFLPLFKSLCNITGMAVGQKVKRVREVVSRIQCRVPICSAYVAYRR